MLCLSHIDQPVASEKRNPTRFLINAFCAALVMCLLLFVSGCGSLLFSSGYPRYEGTVRALPLESPVKVVRDSWGIPHIYAENNLDLMAAQGFVHAQDRLWQMELFRRLTQGRVAEIAGEAAVMSDYFVKLIGFPTLTKRAAAEVSAEDRRMVQAYVDGVNASLALQQKQKKLPIEFKLLGLTPEPWTVEDAFGVLAAVSWFFQANYTSEILAVKARTKLSRSDWDLLFPSHPGAVFPGDEYFESIRTLRIAPFHKAAVAFYDSFFGSSSNGGSNSWAVARSRDGMPLLANDTHMTLMVPNIWYVCHLDSPDMHVAGFSIAGSPGIFIGHNKHIAWGFTNLVLDAQDLFVLETDPRNPMRYRVGDRWLTMEEERVTVGLPQGRERVMSGYRTVFGPVITELTKEAEAVVALKWYGSLDHEELKDKSTHGFFELAKAASVEEAINAGSNFAYLEQNMVVAGKDGRIAYHALGAVPIRRGYSGRLPAFGSGGRMDWVGFLPYDEMPGRVDPPEGWLVTANNRVTADRDPQPISFSWSKPYRMERIAQFLAGGTKPTAEDFIRMQMDVHSRFADAVLDRVLAYPSGEPLAFEARRILRAWDREVRQSSAGALIFEVFVVEWVKALLEDELGEDLSAYFDAWPSAYSVEDVILDHPESLLWDRIDTSEREGPAEILDMALVRTMMFLQKRQGQDTSKWSWGRLHSISFSHPAGVSPFLGVLLNRGPFPAEGSLTTVNVAGYRPGSSDFRVVGIPTMRLVVPLGNLDETRVVNPPGQSGVPSHPHYDDMIKPWREGREVPLPFSREAVEASAAGTLWLRPAQ